jgi:NUMOD3 motif
MYKSNSLLLTLAEETNTVTEWSKIVNIPIGILTQRKNKLGWDDTKTLTTPVRKLKGDDGEYLPKKKYIKTPHIAKTFDTENIYYVYQIICPNTDIVKYVGKGKGTRCYEHLRDKGIAAHNARLNGWIRNLIEANNPPIIIKVIENVDEQQAYNIEEAQIKLHGRLGYDDGGVLFNVLENGSAPNNKGKDHPWFGRNHTQESKDKISKANTGKISNNKGKTGIHTPETLKKMSDAKIGKKQSIETINKRVFSRKSNPKPQTEKQKKIVSELMQKQWIVTDPNGVEYEVTNLLQFCLNTPELGKNATGNLTAVAKGRLTHHKKWKARHVI